MNFENSTTGCACTAGCTFQGALPPKPEILAPAGNFEKLRAALRFGADAVYLAGQQFGLRAYASNFSPAEMKEAVAYAHALGRKVYVTANIYAHTEDLAALPDYLAGVEDCGVDAILVSDPGVFRLARKHAPNTELHISTQASVTNAEACKFWYDAGARRIVLARELSLDEIRAIRREIPADLELETFVHGAMCMSYSGRCLLSNALTGRDANRGACSQPCRWRYELVDPRDPTRRIGLEEDERGSYFLSSRDLCLLPELPQLVLAGISSLKIEGRMKGAYYVAVVVKAYREALDRFYEDPGHYEMDPAAMTELSAMVHRPYATGFYFDKPIENAQVATEATALHEAIVLGVVEATELPAASEMCLTPELPVLLRCSQRNKMRIGDEIQAVCPHGPTRTWTVDALWDAEGQPITDTPHATMTFYLRAPDPLEPGSFLRKWGDKDHL